MKIKAPELMITAALILQLTACTDTGAKHYDSGPSSQHENQYIDMLARLKEKDPQHNAREAILKGQRFFLCQAGRSSTVPGLGPMVYQSLKTNCPTKCLEGVTDTLQGKNHRRYSQAAQEYATRWNQVMATACQ